MGNRRRTKPRNTNDRRDRARRNDARTLTDRPMKRLEGVAALWRLYEKLAAERFHMIQRQAALKAGTPKAGREALVERIIERYGEEIADITRRITMLEVKLERAGVRI